MSDDIKSDQDPQNNETSPTMAKSMLHSIIGLGIFAIVTAGFIALTQLSTADRIEEQIRLARSKALFEISPLDEHNNDLLSDAFTLQAQALGLTSAEQAFIAKQDGLPVALILPVIAPDGYTGSIRLIVGIDVSGKIQGVRVTEHRETPGLGDKIDLKKSAWILGFEDKSLSRPGTEGWQVKKDGGEFDQLTGATITPRAIVRAVFRALRYFQENQAALLAQQPGTHFQAGMHSDG